MFVGFLLYGVLFLIGFLFLVYYMVVRFVCLCLLFGFLCCIVVGVLAWYG